MKKKLAVFANGWSYEALSHALSGMRKYAALEDFDVFVFMCFANHSSFRENMIGELGVYKLCNLQDYDGAIVFSNMLNSDETAVEICREAQKHGLPVISIGKEIEGATYVGVDGNTGMRELVTHLVEKHGVKKVWFIGGRPEHEESNQRLAVTKAVLKEHGHNLPKKNIGYGSWSNRRTVDAMHEMFDRDKKLPDAIVCANDIMAMATVTELYRLGYELPKDVIVTGFDHTMSGRILYPALTTVRQDFEELGYECCRMIYEYLRDGKPMERILAPAHLIVGESCGCKGDMDHHAIRKHFCQHYYEKNTDAASMEQTERDMRQKISEVGSYEELKESIRGWFGANHLFEGSNLCLALNADYYRDATCTEEEIAQKKQKRKMEVIVSLKNGVTQYIDQVDRSKLIPGYEKEEGVQHVYYFLPLHYLQYNYGYFMLADEPYLMTAELLYPYMEKLLQAFRVLRTNLRLDMLNKNLTKLYDRDPMTDLFNRFGYENRAIPLYQESVRKKSPMMVMFVDINFMKRINDQFGHIHGDTAIKTVAEAIKANVQPNWIAVRFGGDEFLIIAPDCDDQKAIKVKYSILDYMEAKNNDGTRPYRISASCGYVITEPGSDYPLQEYIREADKLMYEIKREVHARDEVERALEAQARERRKISHFSTEQ
ncbi:MAG: GGDEF domain-containing protein [Lachnospiraceae bacterium]|nr:GGDEF domain-containing protein [Lachnospiraceae bacterium]